MTFRARRALIALLALAALAPATADAAGPAARFDAPVTDGPVKSLLRVGGKLYVGGAFAQIGPDTGSGVPVDGDDGTRIGDARFDGPVYTTVSDGVDGWYVGGDFTQVSGVPQPYLAHILSNGTLDPSFQPEVDGRVERMTAITDGDIASQGVFIAGPFTHVGGVVHTGLAAVQPVTGRVTSWNSANDVPSYPVKALATDGTNVFVGMGSRTFDGVNTGPLVALDGSTGVRVGSFASLAAAWTAITALAVSSDGSIYFAGSQTATTVIRRANSTTGAADATWTPANPNSDVRALAVVPGGVLVGGYFSQIGSTVRNGLAKLSSAGAGATDSWAPMATAGSVYAIATTDNSAYIGGYFDRGSNRNAMKVSTTGTGAIDSGWQLAADGPVSALAISAGGVLVGGSLHSTQTRERPGLAAIDLATGAVDPVFTPALHQNANTVDGIPVVKSLAMYGGALYAAGSLLAATGQTTFTWGVVKLNPTDGDARLWGPSSVINGTVNSIAVDSSNGDVYAGGDFTAYDGRAAHGVARLLAATGRVDAAWLPNVAGNVLTVARSLSNTTYIGGDFASVNGSSTYTNLAEINSLGSPVSSFHTTLDGEVRTMAVGNGGFLYLGGQFRSIGGETHYGLGRVSQSVAGVDSSWNPNADGGSTVSALTLDGQTVIFGGDFDLVGGQRRTSVAAVDNATGALRAWAPPLTGEVLSLAGDFSALAVGGDFDRRGGASNLALFGPHAPVAVSSPGLSGRSAPGELVTCIPGTFTDTDATTTSTFKWLLDGDAITGATGATYTPQVGDVGHQLACSQTVTNAVGATTRASPTATVVPKATDGTNGTNGANGADGSNGSNGETGAQGGQGSPGAQGERGVQGVRGPAGPSGKIVCDTKAKKGKVTCRLKLSSSTRAGTVRIARNGRVLAVGRLHGGQVRLTKRQVRRLRPGTYRLTVRLSSGRVVSSTLKLVM